uniref:Uncharacterized protein n=1 Tax=Arundo donax TaxID=35708 RepID=A0A0A9G9J6_ARUDO
MHILLSKMTANLFASVRLHAYDTCGIARVCERYTLFPASRTEASIFGDAWRRVEIYQLHVLHGRSFTFMLRRPSLQGCLHPSAPSSPSLLHTPSSPSLLHSLSRQL